MKHPRVMDLKDTKITIEIEAIRHPDEMIEETLKQLDENEEGVVFPYTLVTRLKIGDRQIGLVQGLLVMARVGTAAPVVALDIAAPEGLSPALKESLDITAAQLRQFPFINWALQGEPGGNFQQRAVMGRSVEELALQLDADLRGEKDWHDRAVDAAVAAGVLSDYHASAKDNGTG